MQLHPNQQRIDVYKGNGSVDKLLQLVGIITLFCYTWIDVDILYYYLKKGAVESAIKVKIMWW